MATVGFKGLIIKKWWIISWWPWWDWCEM